MTSPTEFPPYPEVADLPAGMTEEERYRFAFQIMAEQGEGLGDYIFAAVRQSRDHDEEGRWLSMAELMQAIKGAPIYLTYRACDRIEAERPKH